MLLAALLPIIENGAVSGTVHTAAASFIKARYGQIGMKLRIHLVFAGQKLLMHFPMSDPRIQQEHEAGNLKAACCFFVGLALATVVMSVVLIAVTHGWAGW